MGGVDQALCTRCGLCCDGTLFESVALHADDVRARKQPRARKLPVVSTVDGPKLAQPCAALEGVLCGVYAERPRRCAEFACELLRNVEAGRRSVVYATAMIDRVRELVDRIPLEGMRWWSLRRRLSAQRGALDEEHRLQLADLDRLERLLTAHFL